MKGMIAGGCVGAIVVVGITLWFQIPPGPAFFVGVVCGTIGTLVGKRFDL